MIFDSRESRCKTPFGAVAAGTLVTLRLFLPIVYQLVEPTLLLFRADEWDEPKMRLAFAPEDGDGVREQYALHFTPEEPGLYFYQFEVRGVNGPMCIAPDKDGFGRLMSQSSDRWQLTVYDGKMHTPDFLKSGVMYQIFPDRFYNSGQPKEDVPADRHMHGDWYELPEYLPDENGEITNSDYFGGDLAGIAEKLPYLHSLGVRVLYLNPVFEAHSNHRYNTADYMKIDPLLGKQEDLENLCAQAKALGMYVLLDGVFNHTGSDSVYFNLNRRYGDGGAYNDPQSPYRTWYNFIRYPDEYESWWGFRTLPNVNENDEGYVDFICGENGVLRTWIARGVSGFRLDVADELPDSFLDRVCAAIKSAGRECAVIGEVWEDASTKVAYGVRRRYLLGKQLDSVMNYPFKEAILGYVRHGSCHQFFNTVMSILENYPKPVLDVLMNSISTHDVERALTMLAGEPAGWNDRNWQGQNHRLSEQRYEHGKKLMRLAAVLQYMLPGIPCLYYGDEAGLYGYKDPFNRLCYPWGREDQDLLELFTRLGALRTAYPYLSTASFSALTVTPETAAFVRTGETGEFYTAVNRTSREQTVLLPMRFQESTTRLLFGEFTAPGVLPAYGCAILFWALSPAPPKMTRGRPGAHGYAKRPSGARMHGHTRHIKKEKRGFKYGITNKRAARDTGRSALAKR